MMRTLRELAGFLACCAFWAIGLYGLARWAMIP